MTHELIALALVCVLHLVLVRWSQALLNRDIGINGNTSPRDGDLGLAQDTLRLRRALANHTENIGLFIAAVVIVTQSDQSTWFTAICAYIYVAARAVYIPAYRYGWAPWRSVIYLVGLLTTFLMIIAAFI